MSAPPPVAHVAGTAGTGAAGSEATKLDRPALERVLARAAELHALESDPDDLMLSEEQLVEVGREVGLGPENIRQALAEERTRVVIAAEAGALSRVLGPAVASASRSFRGSRDAVFGALDSWMQREECLRVKRLFPDRMLWEPRGGFSADIKRVLNIGGRGYHLSRAHEVAATVVQAGADRVVVRLDADLSNVRAQYAATGGSVGVGGGVSTAVLLALGFMPVLAVVPIVLGAGVGFALARRHSPIVARAQLALEQVLDRLERGDMPSPRSSLLQTLAEGKLLR